MGINCPKCHFDNPADSKFCKECGTQLLLKEEISVSPTETLETPKEELTTGSVFAGRYQIIEELGKGGMGKVYRVLDKKLSEEVAIKLVKPEIASDKKTLERFSNELKFARKIVHKNVGRMYHLSEEKGTHYITMEYVPGEDLKGMIRMMGQLGAGKSISIAKQVCEGLVEAHTLGVIHRDLKPSNIMIDKEGNARIMDFGIARSLEAKGITGAGVIIGTPEYMSPDQVEGKEVDQRSDIYSLGVILYEMVTGRVPFEGDTPLSIAVKHKTETPKEPKEFNTQIPEDLNLVILICLEKNKEKRYQSAGELQSELTKIEKGIPTTERIVPKRKPITSREITVTFGLKKLFIPALVAVALIIAVVIIWQLLPQKEAVPMTPVKNSIAVLPFTDLSPKKDQEYLCDGMTDEIIAKLSQIEKLKVISRTSAMRYKNTDKDIKEISRELDVATILEGSVRKEKDDIRITVQLIDVEDSFQLWSNIYNRKHESVFVIQSDIAERIAKALKMRLTPEEEDKLDKKATENLEAYNSYLKGRYFWNKRTGDSLKMSIEYFEQAIEVDPDYALAYTGLADCYIILPFYSDWLPKEAYLKARSAALKALELDGMLAEAHNSLAAVKLWYDWDWNASEREFKRAIELNAGLSIIHHWYAELLKSVGRIDEAIGEIKIALELDPVSLMINTNFGMYLYLARRYDEAIKQFRKTLEIDPEFEIAHNGLGYTYLQKGMYKQAVKIFERTESPVLAHALMTLGKKEEALGVLEDFKEKSSQQYVDPYTFAVIYAGLGEIDMTFEALERAYQEHSLNLVDYVYVTPVFDSIRSDPRFKSLMKKLNFDSNH